MKAIKYTHKLLHVLVDPIDRLHETIEEKRLTKLLEAGLKDYLSNSLFSNKLSYEVQKFYYINHLINDESILEIFREKSILPKKYGSRLDERVVEYPWVLSRIANKYSKVLDAGSALNHYFLLEARILSRKSIDIITLAPESNCFWNKRISYLFSDLRNIPIRDSYYDEIICISTLEHIGMNNEMYDSLQVSSTINPNSFQEALHELKRVLKPNGTLLITVPFGKPTHINWLQQFGTKEIDFISHLFADSIIDIIYYRYQDQGWQISDQIECISCEYLNPGVILDKDFNQVHFVSPTATAIACVEIKAVQK